MEATNTTTGKTYIYTGPLLTDEGKWIKYDLNFSVPISANMTTNEVTIGLQNRNKLITGNDYYIDDILVSTLHTDPLTIDVSNTGPVCEGSPIQLIVNSGGDALPFTYAWTGPNGFNSAESSPILSNSTANMSGVYNVTVTDALGQVATATTNVIVNTVPKSDFSVSGNTIDNKNNIVTFSITPEDGVEYEWDLGDGTKEKGSTFTHTYSIDGNTYEYKIQLKSTISQGCSSTTSKTIEVTPFVPNVFSPNGDGVNDHFMAGFDTKVFDRSGNLLYSDTSGWDGTYHGRVMDNDTYFYLINYTNKNKEVNALKGFVILKR
jgi:gliding motility-associated-like protein